MNLDKQVAIVTGGASGMGAATALQLRARGLRVMVWDTRLTDDGDSILCDVTDHDAVSQALQTTIARFGIPRVCVNCAGIAPAKRMVGKEEPMPLAEFQKVIQVNLIGTFNVMRLVAQAMTSLPVMDESGERGVIINTASIAAYEGQIGQIAYSASKGGIVAMTLPAARELAQFGIRVNTIAPGLVATPLLLNMPQAVQDSLAETVPFPKRFGHPDEFAALVIHMIENTLLNGAIVRLDGALRMQPK